MNARPARELPAWQRALAEGLSEALPRLLEAPADPLVQELIAALTAALCRGEVELFLEGEAPEAVSADAWPEGHRRALEASRLCRDPDGPLALKGPRLAWRRWRQRQEMVLSALIERARPADTACSDGADACRDGALTADAFAHLDDRQRSAVQAALGQRLVLILGGPGTGKTSTVAAVLSALRARQSRIRVALAAPTGKAAARLRAATGGEVCTTLHRLLESRGDGFGRHRLRPLELDLLVIDEVSMVDLELMEAVLAALPPACRLVLVGDPAQLPAIAPGPVLLTLQEPALRQALSPACIELTTTYRNDGAIARVAAALRASLAKEASVAPIPGADALETVRPLLQVLQASDNLSWQEASSARLPAAVLQRLAAHLQRLADLAARCWPGLDEGWAEVLAERDRLLVLSPLRRGRWGIDAIHRALLGAGGDGGEWPCGTPLLCRRNLPELGLANGDIGVLVTRPGEANAQGAERRVLFGQEAPLWFHPAQLSGALEPALALTVHKAQGSEARELIVLLEDGAGTDPRLLYTALTRARELALLITGRSNA